LEPPVGLYRYTRNPMYVGVLTVILGWALLYRSSAVAIYAVVVATCFHSFVVFFEERVLGVRFSAEYERYCAEVPRGCRGGDAATTRVL